MDQKTTNSSIPSAVARKLRQVRQRKMFVQLLSATIAAVAVLLAAMGVAMLIDWLATLYDWRWRAVLTTAALATAGATVVGWLFVVWRRGLRWDRLAHDVDRQLPQMEQRWTTMTRLGKGADDPSVVHPAMLRRVAWEATKWEPHVDPNQVVSTSALGRAMFGLTLIAATLLVAVLLDSHRTIVLLRRFWWPGASISATELVGAPGNIVVGKGEPVELTAAIKGSPVERAMLFMRTVPDVTDVVTLVASGNDPIEFSHRVRAVDAPFNYLFRAGDGQTEWYQVDVAERPEIGEVRLTVTPPEYTGRTPAALDRLPRRLAALQKSTLELAIRPTVPLKTLQLRMGDDSLVDMTSDADGWYRWTTQLEQSFTFAPFLTEVRGLTNRRVTKTQIAVLPDKPPVVNITAPNDQVAVRPDDTLQVHFTAQDDNGIGQAEMIVYADSDSELAQTPLLVIPIDLEDQAGARKIEGIVDLDLSKLQVTDGTRLSYEIRVSESRDGQINAAAAQRSNENVAPVRGALPSDMAIASATPVAANADATTATTSANSANPTNSDATDAVARNNANPTAGPASSNSTPAAATAPPATSVASQNNSNGATPSSQTPSNQNASSSSTAQTGADGQPTSPAANAADRTAATDPAAATTPAAANDVTANDSPTPAADGPRTASSGRQSMSTSMPSENPADAGAMANANSTPPNGDANMASASPSTQNPSQSPNNSAQANAGQASGNNNQSQNSMASASSSSSSSSSSTPPPDGMSRRSLDVPAQAASSQRMQIQVDQWAGSFEGQQRQKLEMAIAPELEALDKALARAEQFSRGVLDEIDAAGAWRAKHDRDITNAERSTVDGQHVIRSLQQKTHNTPYAFIGLQLVDIGTSHVNPARQSFWTSLQTSGEAQISAARDGWQHVVRARQMIAELKGQFERTQREFELAEKLQQVKKMYQVFIENSFGLINPDPGSPNRYNRDIAEFNLDEEYLKRLREVLEMRREMMAELARILAEDPRLLQRYMDLFRNRAANLREDLADLVAEQNDLNREVMAWSRVTEDERPRIAQILLLRHVLGANDLAVAAGRVQDRYQTWLPLNRQTKDADLEAATKLIQAMATTGNELGAKATAFDAETRRARLRPTTATGDGAEAAATEQAWNSAKAFADLRSNADQFAARLRELDVMLRQMGARNDDAEIAVFAANRLVEARRLIADTTAWIRQTDEHQSGNYPRAAEVEQYRLAEGTERIAGRLGDIEQTLAGLLQRPDRQLPEPIAEKAKEFFAALDKQAAPNQLAAVYALRGNQMPRVLERQSAAHQGLVAAEKAYDEMIQLAIVELDKLPVQDPIAGLLDDPTLDELLAALEQELPLAELLGIPGRPSNLQIIADWMRPGGGGAGAMMLGNQMRMRGQQARNRLDRSLREAVARALKESQERQAMAMTGPRIDWNRLVSELDDELQQGRDKAPPEQYRRAISQYFNEISRAAAEKTEQQ